MKPSSHDKKHNLKKQSTAERLEQFSDDALVARWHKIITVVRKELAKLNRQRQYMQEATDIVNANPHFLEHPGRKFMDYARDWYGTAMGIAYRRQIDSNHNSASLRVMLAEMQTRPQAYRLETLRPFMGIASDHTINSVISTFSISGTLNLDPEIIHKDDELLMQTGETVRLFVNKHVAHTDLTATEKPFVTSFNEIHAAAITCESIALRWVTALTGSSRPFDTSMQSWQSVFDFPWRLLQPNEESGTKRYIVTVHPCLEPNEENPLLDGYSTEERERLRIKRLFQILTEAESIEPHQEGCGGFLHPNLLSIKRVL